MSNQSEFPFASLDFPGRGALRPAEIAERLNISEDQVIKLYEEGEFSSGIDASSRKSKSGRKWLLIPVECYRDFVIRRIEGSPEIALNLLLNLPPATLKQLYLEIAETLKKKGHL